MNYREISPRDIADNLFERIGGDWLLLCAGTEVDCNAMTCSWGQAGILWNKPVATVYVRPSRYTRQFMEREDRFSLSFFAPGSQRNALNIMGSKSGRDGDKVAEAGLCVRLFDGVPAFEEATLVLVCRKLYVQDMEEACFLNPATVETNYPGKDFHRMYVGEIERTFAAD